MIIKNTDLFTGLSEDTLTEISKAVITETYPEGTVIYTDQDPANYFYTLLNGRVELAMGKDAQIDYTVNLRGEVFGWSSMVDRPSYSTTAKCVTTSEVAKISKQKLNEILDKNPHDKAMFFKLMASAVVQRLIDSYAAYMSAGSLSGVTYGCGQVMGSEE